MELGKLHVAHGIYKTTVAFGKKGTKKKEILAYACRKCGYIECYMEIKE